MGLRKAVPLAYKFSGLNTVLDPERLQQGSGGTQGNGYEVELAAAVNVSIDDRGQASLRNGSVLQQAGSFHSLFCKGGDSYAVQEGVSTASIVKLISGTPVTTTVVRSGLTKNLRMSWDQDEGGDIFYSNGAENGYIRSGVNYAWPINTYQGSETDRQFATSIPLANHVAFLQGGWILLAVGSAIFINHTPFQYGLFEPMSGNVAAFQSSITLLVGVEEGFFASDGEKTWFFKRTSNPYQFQQILADDAPAHIGSLAHDRVRLVDVGVNMDGNASIWATNKGVCLGYDSGVVVNRTKEKVNYPSGYDAGACLLKDFTVIHTAE